MAGPGDLESSGHEHHIPVLVQETLSALAVRSGGCYLDATVGGGGHARAILEASGPDGKLLGLDRDRDAAIRASQGLSAFGKRARVFHSSYIRLYEIASREGFLPLDGVLFDLGFSSWQVDDPARGFSFREEGPLDMRYDPGSEEGTAADLVNTLGVDALAEILRIYGEEPRSRRIAQAIVAGRPFYSTVQLSDAVMDAVGGRRDRLHPATRTFQALRIAVNRELEALERALPQALAALKIGGRLVVITFHSLEDRIVKRFLQTESQDCICPPQVPVCTCDHHRSVRVLNRKPVVPSEEEVASNPRSRSAKLRAAEKIADFRFRSPLMGEAAS